MDALDALNAELERALGKPRAGASLGPLPAQLDLDGTPHEIAPQTEPMRLFEPAPAQLPGQTFIDTDPASERQPCDTMLPRPTRSYAKRRQP
jgi:hypothetical protein